jgi:hypothetical protein
VEREPAGRLPGEGHAVKPRSIAACVCAAALLASPECVPAASSRRIPALPEVPAAVAAAHPEFAARRAALVRERAAFHARVGEQYARCKSVEVGSPQDESCIRQRQALEVELDRHIARSNRFIAALHAVTGPCSKDEVRVNGLCVDRANCVRDAGYQLAFDLRDCRRDRPSFYSYSCLKGTGIDEKSLACLATLPVSAANPAPALVACGILGTVPIDALARCRDVTDTYFTRALKNHEDRVAGCGE